MSIDVNKFWSRVERADDGCWVWKAGRTTKGYGMFAVERKNRGAHRISFELANGPIPPKMMVCHRCDNPPCVRPDHLFLGTSRDNMLDASAKGRIAKGERHNSRTRPESIPRGEQHWARRKPERVMRGDEHWSRKQPDLVVRGERHYLRQHPERVRGEKNAAAKLTPDQAIEIRRLRATTEITYQQLADRFGVSMPTIGNIVTRRTWAHLKESEAT